MSTSTLLLALVLSIGASVTQARYVAYGHGRSLLQVTTALVGYQQGVYLGFEGADPSGECSVSGIPGPDGYSPAGPSPVLFTTPKGTGVHVISNSLPAGWSTTVVVLSNPASQSYSIDNTDPHNPALVFNASQANEGESGIAGIEVILGCGYLINAHNALYATVYDAANTYICKSTISFQVTAPLGCLPSSTGPVIPQPTGNTVYLDSSVSSTIIQQITVVNSVNIINIQNVNNINQVTCICCYNSCNNNYFYDVVYNITVNNNTSPPVYPPYPAVAPPPKDIVPPVYPPSSAVPPPRSTTPFPPPRSAPPTPPPRAAPPPVTGGSTTPPPRASFTTPTSPPPTSQAPPPGNRTTFNLTPPAGKK